MGRYSPARRLFPNSRIKDGIPVGPSSSDKGTEAMKCRVANVLILVIVLIIYQIRG